MSRNQAARHYGVAISTAIHWVRRFRETGSVAPGQMGGHKPKKIRGEHEEWLKVRHQARAFTLNGLVGELAERGLKVDYRSVWEFVHAQDLTFKKKRWWLGNGIVRTSREGVGNGLSTRAGSTPAR
jgi:putative transposase